MDRIKEIDDRMDVLDKLIRIARSNYDVSSPNASYEGFVSCCKTFTDEYDNLSREYRFLVEPEFENIPEYGDKMTLKSFIGNCKDGNFIDYDGYGYYSKKDKMSDIIIFPSDIKHKSIRKDFDHIIWFNR